MLLKMFAIFNRHNHATMWVLPFGSTILLSKAVAVVRVEHDFFLEQFLQL